MQQIGSLIVGQLQKMMGHRRILLCFAVILISSLAGALFEEQAGEYDWKIESIGVIEQSFVQV